MSTSLTVYAHAALAPVQVSGVIGAAVQAGIYEAYIRVQDSLGSVASDLLTFEVVTNMTFVSTLPAFAAEGQPFEGKIVVQGGVPPYVVQALNVAQLPDGINASFDARNGVLALTGVPTGTGDAAALFSLVVVIHDSAGMEGQDIFTFTVCPRFRLQGGPTTTDNSFDLGTTSETAVFEAPFGGCGAVAFNLAPGNATPAGLSVNCRDGRIGGTPKVTAGGRRRADGSVFIRVQDGDRFQDTGPFPITVGVNDCSVASNGPNNDGCNAGTCVDIIRFDGAFICDCMAIEATTDSNCVPRDYTAAIISACMGGIVIFLIVLILLYRRRVARCALWDTTNVRAPFYDPRDSLACLM